MAEYTAFSNQGFLLNEVVQLARQLNHGLGLSEARRQAIDDNWFQLRSISSRKTIVNAVVQRLEGVSPAALRWLVEGDRPTQRLVNLYLILQKHLLLQEFLQELVADKIDCFSYQLSQSEIRLYFQAKREQVPQLSAWSEATFAKSCRNILTMLKEASLLERKNSSYLIHPPVLSPEPTAWLRDEGMGWLLLTRERV